MALFLSFLWPCFYFQHEWIVLGQEKHKVLLVPHDKPTFFLNSSPSSSHPCKSCFPLISPFSCRLWWSFLTIVLTLLHFRGVLCSSGKPCLTVLMYLNFLCSLWKKISSPSAFRQSFSYLSGSHQLCPLGCFCHFRSAGYGVPTAGFQIALLISGWQDLLPVKLSASFLLTFPSSYTGLLSTSWRQGFGMFYF